MEFKSPEEPSLSPFPQPNWTWEEDKQFEKLLAEYTGDQGPQQYETIASRLQNKSADQVLMHHAALVTDLESIDAGLVPMPYYPDEIEVGPVGNENNEVREMAEEAVVRAPKKTRNPECKWTQEEHRLFLEGLVNMGKGDWRGISRNFVLTRSPTQVASHAQKYFKRQSEQGTKKRKSIHDVTIDDLHVQQSNTNSLVSQQADRPVSKLQHTDHAQWQQQQQQQQPNPLVLDSQYSNHAQQQERHQQTQQQFDLLECYMQDTDHAQWQEPEQPQDIHQLVSDLQYVDHEQWQELQRQQQQQHQQEIEQLVADSQNVDNIQQLEEQLIQHNRQGVQKEQLIQQKSNKNEQLVPDMTLSEINEGRVVKEEKMIQQNANGDDQPISSMMLTVVSQGLGVQEEPKIQQNLDEDSQLKPMMHHLQSEQETEVDQGRGLQEGEEELIFDNDMNMMTWTGCYRL